MGHFAGKYVMYFMWFPGCDFNDPERQLFVFVRLKGIVMYVMSAFE